MEREQTCEVAPYGSIEASDSFVNANIVPVAHIAVCMYLAARQRDIKENTGLTVNVIKCIPVEWVGFEPVKVDD